MQRPLSTLLLVSIIVSLIITPTAPHGRIVPMYENEYKVVATKHYDIYPIGMFKNYVIGYRGSELGTELLAINVYNDTEKRLGTAEGYGLDISKLRFWKTSKYFMISDGKTLVIWDNKLRQMGRYAQEGLRGATILPSDYLVAWTDEVVTVFKGPLFAYGERYDVWEATYKFFSNKGIQPEYVLEITGYDIDEIKKEIVNDLLSQVAGENVTIVDGPHIYFNYDLQATTPEEARNKLRVHIVASTYINKTVYAATNIEVMVVVEGTLTYSVTEENKTVNNTVSTSRSYVGMFGGLITISENGTNITETYSVIEAGTTTSAMAYAYVPALEEALAPRILTIIKDNKIIKEPLYMRTVTNIYVAGNYEFVKSENNVVEIYNDEKYMGSLYIKEIHDVGVSEKGDIYIIYSNDAGVLELWLFEECTGRYGKYTLETDLRPRGAYVTEDVLFLAGMTNDNTCETVISAKQPVAKLIVKFTDIHGYMIKTILSGKIHVVHGTLEYYLDFRNNPVVIEVPVPSKITVKVEVPYGHGIYEYVVNDAKTYEFAETVYQAITPGMTESWAIKPFYNPFFRDYVIVRDSELMKYTLPGAKDMDAYGIFLAMIHAPKYNVTLPYTTISLYRVDGFLMYSKMLPGVLDEIRFFYPYLAVKGDRHVYLLDALTGNIKVAVTMSVDGYDVDVVNEYLSVWSKSKIAVVDVRRQVTLFFDMTRYGTVLCAPIVNGYVYAYISSGNTTSIYVLDPVSRSIADVYPWNGDRIVSFTSDGRFHAVSYILNNNYFTDILSSSNGITVLDDGPVVWIKSIGRTVDLPNSSRLLGNEFAAVAVRLSGTSRVYVVGINSILIQELNGMGSGTLRFAPNYIAELIRNGNISSIVVLKDYSGMPRVTLLPSMQPVLLAISENLLAYGDSSTVYLVPNPYIIGKYKVIIHVYDEQGNPLDASIHLKEFNLAMTTTNGVFETYLSIPGTYHVKIKAKYYKEEEISFTVNDKKPVVEIKTQLKPETYKLTINVETPTGERVRTGIIRIHGVSLPYDTEIDLSKTAPLLTVRRGVYEISYHSDKYTPAKVTVKVFEDTIVTLLVNRTAIKVTINVVDETGTPLPNATVKITSISLDNPIELYTDERGKAEAYIPYGISFNITASYPGYRTYRKTNINATEELEFQPIVIRLEKIHGTITIILQDEEGKQESANIVVKDQYGNIIQTLQAEGAATIDVELGTYIIDATTPDGRTASATVTLTEESPITTVTLTFPKKPAPTYVVIFPYLVIAIMVASVAVIIYKKYIRKPGPEKVGE